MRHPRLSLAFMGCCCWSACCAAAAQLQGLQGDITEAQSQEAAGQAQAQGAEGSKADLAQQVAGLAPKLRLAVQHCQGWIQRHGTPAL